MIREKKGEEWCKESLSEYRLLAEPARHTAESIMVRAASTVMIAALHRLLAPPPLSSLAFSPRRLLIKRNYRKNRYFTQERILPPLQRITTADKNDKKKKNIMMNSATAVVRCNDTMTSTSTKVATTSAARSSNTEVEHDDDDSNPYTRPIPVTYTNDPQSVSRWLQEHVKPTTDDGQGSFPALGFDVEVRCSNEAMSVNVVIVVPVLFFNLAGVLL